MTTPSSSYHRTGLVDQGYSAKANTQHISTIIGWTLASLGSPLATSEGVIDVITDARKQKQKIKGKTGGINVRHIEGFIGLEVGKEILY